MKSSRRVPRCWTYDRDRSLSTNMVVSEARIESWNPALALKLAPLVTLDDDQLFEFCQLNRDLRIERDAEGVLVLMAPAVGVSSARNLARTANAGVSAW
jgi:hypothetical protein